MCAQVDRGFFGKLLNIILLLLHTGTIAIINNNITLLYNNISGFKEKNNVQKR